MNDINNMQKLKINLKNFLMNNLKIIPKGMN